MIEVKLCMGSRCMMAGASSILDVLEELVEDIQVDYPDTQIKISSTKCQKYCKNDKNVVPVVKINDETVFNASTQVVMEKVMELVARKGN